MGEEDREPDRLEHIERFANVLTLSGVPRMPARVFSALLFTDTGRLTSTELSELLGISAAAVSGAIRYLTQVGLVTRERDRGSRRDHYRVLDDVWQDVILKRDAVLARMESTLAEGLAAIGADSPAGRRLHESVVMFQFLRGEMHGIIDRWYEQRDSLRAKSGN